MFLWLSVLFLLPHVSHQYSTCTDASLNYQGYTYTVDPDTNEKIWSHCKFPNPKYDYARCGLTATSGYHWVCDPDNLISSQGKTPAFFKMLDTHMFIILYYRKFMACRHFSVTI